MGLAEFHVTWVGADERGLYVSILGDSALVPWDDISLDAGAWPSSDWVSLRWAHLDVLLLRGVFASRVEPAMRHANAWDQASEVAPASCGISRVADYNACEPLCSPLRGAAA